MNRSLYTAWVSRVLFPLQERLKHHHSVALRREMELSQWWSPAQLRALQWQRLQKLLLRAQTQSPYYENLFRARGLDARALQSLDDLRHLPFLTKSAIRENLVSLKARNAGSLARMNTGGSSGEPLIFFLGKDRISHDVAGKWRATRWWDVDIGDREIVVWGSPIELGAQDRWRGLRDTLMRTELLPAFAMSDDNLDRFIQRLQIRRPQMLFGYPSSISYIARYAEQHGIRLDHLGVRVVFVTSEKLYDEQREIMTRVFGCPVANGYGGRDAGFIAHQCPAGQLHVTAESLIVEIIGPDDQPVPAGESGEIVVTHLASGDFPFIRYRTGDIGVLSDSVCTCGRGLPVLREIQGRTTDFVVTADGTVMHGLALIYILRDMTGVQQFKIIQETRDWTRVQLIADATFPRDGATHIATQFRRRLGENVTIDIERVDQIPAEKSGKYRYVVSKVSSAAGPQ